VMVHEPSDGLEVSDQQQVARDVGMRQMCRVGCGCWQYFSELI
jgi:hypothetical protein